MTHSIVGLSRRGFLALGALSTLPPGCALPLRDIRQVNLDAIGPDQVLLLGRIRVQVLGEDRTGDAFIRTTASDEDTLLPPEGQVAWLVRRLPGVDVRLAEVTSPAGSTAAWRSSRPTRSAWRSPTSAHSTSS